MRTTSAAQPTARRSIWIELLLYPTHTLPTAAAPVVVGTGLALHDNVFALGPALLGFAASWLIHVAGIFSDNERLLADHPAVREHPELSDALAEGRLSLRQLRWAIAACFALAACTLPPLLAAAGPAVVGLAAIGIVASLGYSVGPWSWTKLGIADPVFFVMFGLVAVPGTYFIQSAHAPPPDAFWLGLPIGALVASILVIDDVRDRAYDARKGWQTPPLRFGLSFARSEFTALVGFAYLMPLWFWLGMGFGPWVLLPWLTLPVALGIVRTMRTDLDFADLHPLSPRAALLSLAYAVLLALGLVVR